MASWLLATWNSILAVASWLVAACSACLHTAWVFIAGTFSWLGSTLHGGLSYLLHFLQYLVWTVLGFFTTSVSYISGFFIALPANSSNETTSKTLTETWDITATTEEKLTETSDATDKTQIETWSIGGWVTNAASLNWASDAYIGLSKGARATQNWVWDGWMWLVLSVAEALTTLTTFFVWVVGSLWSVVCYLISGLWTLLAYVFTSTIGLFTSTASTVTTLAAQASSAVAYNSKLVSKLHLDYFRKTSIYLCRSVFQAFS